MNNLSKCLFCSLSVSVWFENNFEIFREWRRWSHRGLVCTGKSWERFQFWFLNHDEENWWLKGCWWWLQWLFQRWGDWAVWQIGPPGSQWDAWRQGPCNYDHHYHQDHDQKCHHHHSLHHQYHINWILLQEFFFGDEPALLDLVVYAHVAQLVGMIKMTMMIMAMTTMTMTTLATMVTMTSIMKIICRWWWLRKPLALWGITLRRIARTSLDLSAEWRIGGNVHHDDHMIMMIMVIMLIMAMMAKDFIGLVRGMMEKWMMKWKKLNMHFLI